MNRQGKNAQCLAERLATRPKIKKLYYAALFDEPEQIRINCHSVIIQAESSRLICMAVNPPLSPCKA
jgi:hypothetical protein